MFAARRTCAEEEGGRGGRQRLSFFLSFTIYPVCVLASDQPGSRVPFKQPAANAGFWGRGGWTALKWIVYATNGCLAKLAAA